jgi:hypothetical protein
VGREKLDVSSERSTAPPHGRDAAESGSILDRMTARSKATAAPALGEAPAVAASARVRLLSALRRSLDRRPWLLLLALLPLLLATPALANLAGLNAEGDESGYLRLADNLSHGRYLVGRPDQIGSGTHYPDLWFGPGLPIVLVPFVALGAAICATALVITVPWLAYTYSVTDRPLFWGASGGLSLYWATSPYPGELGDWHQTREVFADPRLAHHRPFFDRLRGRPLADQDEELVRAGLDNIRSHPGKYASNVLANVSRLWFDFPYSFQQQRLRPLAFVVPNAFLLVGLVIAAALVTARRRPRLPDEATGFAAFAATAFVLHALLAAYPRMLFALVPVLIWFVVLILSRPSVAGTARR